MTDVQIHPSWFENPIVKKAVEAGGGDALAVLEELHSMLETLDEKAPGVPFAELLATARPEGGTLEARGRVAGMLLENGLTPEEVDDTVGIAGRLMLAEQLRNDGATVRQAVATTGLSTATIYKHHAVEIASERVQKLKALLAGGHSVTSAAKVLKISRATAHRYLRGDVPVKSPRGTREVEIGQWAYEHGYKSAMQQFGVSKSHACNMLAQYRKALS